MLDHIYNNHKIWYATPLLMQTYDLPLPNHGRWLSEQTSVLCDPQSQHIATYPYQGAHILGPQRTCNRHEPVPQYDMAMHYFCSIAICLKLTNTHANHS